MASTRLHRGHVRMQIELDYAEATARQGEDPDITVAALRHLASQFPLIAASRTRAVFDRGDNHVIKVALNDEGAISNGYEAAHRGGYIPIAPCWFEDVDGHLVLVMEKVHRFPSPGDRLPDWTMSVDCAQVGYLADGRLVAYDL